MNRRHIRSGAWMVSAIVMVGTATACEPAPPPASLVVTTTAVGGDASPGDGICEMTTGAGDCSLEAALQEGNALGRAHIQLGAGEHSAAPTTITGEIYVTGTLDVVNTSATSAVSGGPIAIASGASLSVADAAFTPRLSVDGLFVGRRTYMFWSTSPAFTGPRVQVTGGGVAYFENSIVPHDGIYNDGALHNDGVVILNHSNLSAHSLQPDPPAPALHNEGVVHAVASYIDGCSGTAPSSNGYNAASDDSCELSSPTDTEFVEVSYRNHPSYLKQFFVHLLDSSSPLVDAIPAGVNGCGTTLTDDVLGLASRPYDGNADGFALCDIGATELAPFVP